MEETPYLMDRSAASSPMSVQASQTALLILDFQHFIISRLDPEKAGHIAAHAANIRKWALSKGINVVHGNIDITRPLLPQNRGTERYEPMLSTLLDKRDLFNEPDLLHQPYPSVESAFEVTSGRTIGVISALSTLGSDLHATLRERGVKSLLICGISTSGCVLSTAKEAPDLGYITTVFTDGCADNDPEAHKMVLGKFLARQCHVLESEVFMKAWDS